MAIFAYCVISLQELLMPKPTLEAFGFPDATAVTKMLINYVQMTSLLGAFDLDWGSSLSTAFKALAAISAGAAGSSSIECVARIPYSY